MSFVGFMVVPNIRSRIRQVLSLSQVVMEDVCIHPGADRILPKFKRTRKICLQVLNVLQTDKSLYQIQISCQCR